MEKKFPLQSHEQSSLSLDDMQYWKIQQKKSSLSPFNICTNYIHVNSKESVYKNYP